MPQLIPYVFRLNRSNLFATASTATLLAVFLSNAQLAAAHPRPAPGLKDDVHNILLPNPNKTGGPAGEIQCYSLPYGAIGVVSHLLTYWTMAWLAAGYTPVWPWHRPEYQKVDMALAIATLLTCVPIASITIHRCRLTWHFILIAVWKLVTSVALSCITIHRAWLSRREQNGHTYNRVSRQNLHPPQSTSYNPHTDLYRQSNASKLSMWSSDNGTTTTETNKAPLYWFILYFAGTITGMTGLLALNWTSFRHNHDVRSLTYGFGVTMFIIPCLAAAYWYMKHVANGEGGGRAYTSAIRDMFKSSCVASAAAFGFFSALYCDLVLGAIAQNWSGMPADDFAPLYWAWFVAKRFPMLSI